MRRRGRWGAIVITLMTVATGTLVPGRDGRAGALALPEGFTDEFLAQVSAPTAFAFLPDGRMLVATQPGRLYLTPDAVTASPGSDVGRLAVSLDLSAATCSDLERGLLGVAVHPEFDANRAVFVFYTSDDSGLCTHRVSRFHLGPDGVADPASERILLDRIPSPNANHNAGDLHFGRDGYLYVSVGDGGCDYDGGGCAGGNDASRDEHVLLGKVLRITDEGAIPADNPFLTDDADRCGITGGTEPGRRCQETFAWGLRNPFRLAFDPNSETTRFFINDVGQHHWEEIDEGRAGADYGWNIREGRCATGRFDDCGDTPPGVRDPIFDYRHEDGCGAITGGAFVPHGIWPDELDGAYLFGDYNCGTIFRLVPKGDGLYERQALVGGFGPGGPVHLGFGPTTDGAAPALYYTTYQNGGEVRRIAYVGTANRRPVARLAAEPASGSAPLRVTFDAGGSTDPDGDDLVFEWDFGDGSPPAETSEPSAEHQYASEGVYRARVVASDDGGARSAPAEVVVGAGRFAPKVRIASPAADHRFRVGEELVLEASADDAEDGAIPPEQLSWRVLLHHDTHTHPYLGPVAGESVRVTAPAPESISAAANSFLEIHLTATDSDGQSTSVRLDLMPRTEPITFETEPTGFGLAVNAEPLIGPATFSSWTGWALDIEARDQTHDGRTYRFESWSDGGPARHTVITPAAPATYTARFVPEPSREANR